MKKIVIMGILAFASAGVFAQTPALSQGSQSPGSLQQQQLSTSKSDAMATNNNNGLTIQSGASLISNQASVIPTDVTNRQIVSGGTDSTVHQTFGTQTIKNTPSVSGSPLTSSNDTCMGSASGSANVPGIGLSFGKTYTDDNCVMLKNSRELWNMGMKAASMALMCMDKNNRDALEMTGFVCPQSARTQASAKAGEPTDPYIRARMGLPALKE